jgi:polyhydroxyalkanoate synthase
MRPVIADRIDAQKQQVEGEFKLGGRKVELKNITIAVLNSYGDFDTLVSPASSKAMQKHVGGKGAKN